MTRGTWRTTLALIMVISFSMSIQAARPGDGVQPASGAGQPARVIHSSDLGWKADQDITEAFAGLLKGGELKAGDELVLDHRYRIAGSHKLPDNFTLSAKKGAGFEVTDAYSSLNAGVLTLGSNTTLRNLLITYLYTPDTGGMGIRAAQRGIDVLNRTGIVLPSGGKNILFENCRFDGMIAHHVRGVECDLVTFTGCQVVGGFWAVTIWGGEDLVFRNCLFERSAADAYKGGTDGGIFENCLFQDCTRDAIDTTGGLNDTVVRNCVLRRLGREGMDLKSFYEREVSVERPQNNNILVENCLFHDVSNAFVFSLLDGSRRGKGKGLVTADNAAELAPHNIDINDCTFGHAEKPLRKWAEGGYGVNYPSDEGEHMRVLFLKDAHSIRYRNARLSGERIRMVYVSPIGGTSALSKEASEAIDHTTITGGMWGQIDFYHLNPGCRW